MKIAVIGGGYTGLVAAYELLKAGNEVDILEKSNELGGLAGGFKIGGKPLEKAYHHIFRTDKEIIALAKELGLEDKLKWHASSVAIYYEGKIYPFVTPIDLIKFTPLPFIDRIRAGITALFLQKYRSWRQFIHIPAYTWMKNGEVIMLIE
jgi:protoporphyrinogen oxidase